MRSFSFLKQDASFKDGSIIVDWPFDGLIDSRDHESLASDASPEQLASGTHRPRDRT